MELFPSADPIPLPAPVWIFKALHQVTLLTHFVALQLLLGGLILIVAWAILGRGRPAYAQAAGMVARRLPVVMAYVVNLGVPPLLFAQVLYGRALYTSSVLIGPFWLAIILLVIGSYYGLYVSSRRASEGKPWSGVSFASLILALAVGFIYSTNMTLMLRPDTWVEMYRADPTGVHLSSGDPTVLPRWLFMVIGSLVVSGIALILMGRRTGNDETGAGLLLGRTGGLVAATGVFVQALLGFRVLAVQSDVVREGLAASSYYAGLQLAWFATAIVVLALAALVAVRATTKLLPALALAAFGTVNVLATVLIRDGIRDLSLLRFGFDVWDRAVATNWFVVVLFLVLFVAGLGVIGWMIKAVAGAEKLEERYV